MRYVFLTKLKWYIIIGSSVFLMSFPISYIFLRMGYAAESVFIVNAVVRAVYILVVIHIIRQYVPLSRIKYLKVVVAPIVAVVMFSGGLSLAFKYFMPEYWFQWMIVGFFSAGQRQLYSAYGRLGFKVMNASSLLR